MKHLLSTVMRRLSTVLRGLRTAIMESQQKRKLRKMLRRVGSIRHLEKGIGADRPTTERLLLAVGARKSATDDEWTLNWRRHAHPRQSPPRGWHPNARSWPLSQDRAGCRPYIRRAADVVVAPDIFRSRPPFAGSSGRATASARPQPARSPDGGCRHQTSRIAAHNFQLSIATIMRSRSVSGTSNSSAAFSIAVASSLAWTWPRYCAGVPLIRLARPSKLEARTAWGRPQPSRARRH